MTEDKLYFQGYAQGEDDFNKGIDNWENILTQPDPYIQGYKDAVKLNALDWIDNKIDYNCLIPTKEMK